MKTHREKTPKADRPHCPGCGNKLQRSILQIADTFKCGRCGAMFDDDPDEGGTAYSDPTRRLEKQEEELARRRMQKTPYKGRR